MVSGQNDANVIVIAPVATSGSATKFASFDAAGFGYCEIDVMSGAFSADMPTVLNIADCDTTTTASFVTITGGSATSSFTTTTFENSMTKFQIDLRKRKRYIALNVTMGTTTGVIAAVARLSRAANSRDTAATQSVVRTGNTVVAVNAIVQV